jgi:RHH-type proline utilization regulon transcriptional repressor/proline dehydrogenase/delta 1-pyrroline-5-carboxylate dehydrogenase
VVDANAQAKIKEYIEKGKQEATLALEMPAPDHGYFVGPTIFTDVAPDAVIAQEEIFGPVLAVIKVKDFEEALEVANNTDYGLTGGLYSRTPSHIERVQKEFAVGNLYINRALPGRLCRGSPLAASRCLALALKPVGLTTCCSLWNPATSAKTCSARALRRLKGRINNFKSAD